ncbi:MAG: hypothetical protein R6T91_06835, partial [Bacteroidales bacterium]
VLCWLLRYLIAHLSQLTSHLSFSHSLILFVRPIASSHHRIIASSHHRIIASSHHRIIASSPTRSARTPKSPPKVESPPHNDIIFWQFASSHLIMRVCVKVFVMARFMSDYI